MTRAEGARIPTTEVFEMMKIHLRDVANQTAIYTGLAIQKIYSDWGGKPPEDVVGQMKEHILDAIASRALINGFNASPFYIHSRSEGGKHILEGGKAAPSAEGVFGNENCPKLEIINDPLEGTTKASKNLPGATSPFIAAALTKEQSLTAKFGPKYEPQCFIKDQEGVHYYNKLVVAGQPDVSLTYTPEKNLKNIIAHHKEHGMIRDEKNLVVIFMDPKTRPFNLQFAQAAENAGVATRVISSGDLMEAVYALHDPSVFGEGIEAAVFMGRGGVHEGLISAGYVKIHGGTMLAQDYHGDSKSYELGAIHTLDQLVPAQRERLLFSSSLVTPDIYSKHQGVQKHKSRNGSFITANFTATHQGKHTFELSHLPREFALA